jgi:uncharacterized SAM-binding protein YcdF (DUF218 family)
MYFVLSKILLVLIFPFTWILLLLIIALVSKNNKYKRCSLRIAIAMLVLFTNPFLFNQFAQSWDLPPYKDDGKNYSCVIVLGGFSTGSYNGDGFFTSASDRFIQGIKLLSTKKATHLLVSGGTGSLLPDEFREAAWVKKQLHEFNYPDSAILIENASRNTKENAKFSKAMLEKAKLKPPYLLVTSAFHMRRSLMIFKKMGVNVVPYPANYMVRRKVIASDFIPAADVLSSWNIYIKEVVGYVANSI